MNCTRKLFASVFTLGLVLSGQICRAQSVDSNQAKPSAIANERLTNLPPVERISLTREGDFRMSPPYNVDPAFIERTNVPKGRLIKLTMNSDESHIFPTVAGRDGKTNGFLRPVQVYIPANYVPGTPSPFIVVQDGTSWYTPDATSRRNGQELPCIPTMLDNLIYEKRVPAMVAILINPGQNRSLEYDTVSDRYTQFIETEVLPTVAKQCDVTFTKDPEGRATFGESSGAAAAIAMSWFHPELYHRVISYSGTFVALRRDPAAAPHGAWDYHENFIPNTYRKPMRIWLEVGERDNGYNTPDAEMRNWVTANFEMAKVLKAKGYHYQFLFAESVGHVSRPVELETMPEAFEWAWKGYAQ